MTLLIVVTPIKRPRPRGQQSFQFCHDKSELTIEVVNILVNCESQVLQTTIKNLKQTSIEKYFKKKNVITT
jgi:hypothetical protein